MKGLEKAAEFVVAECIKRGADEAEAFVKSGEQTTVKVYQGEVELFTKSESRGMGVRVLADRKTGYAFSTVLDKTSLDGLVDDAIENARHCNPDEYAGLPEIFAEIPGDKPTSLLSTGFDSVDSKQKIDFATEMEATALKTDPMVIACEDTLYTDGKENVRLVNSKGFSGEYEHGAGFAYTSVLAGEKDDVMSGFAVMSGHDLTELDPVKIAEEAANQAVMLIGAESIKPRKTTVVFDPLVFIQIIMSISSAFSADAVQKGRSFLIGRRGKKIASENVTLIDDGSMPGGLGTAPFDDEGVPTQKTALIEEGVLTGLLYNSYSARKDRTNSTGNASRGSYKSTPGTSPTNLYVVPGVVSKEQLIKGIADGVFVISVQGLHAGVNAVTGQFSVGAGGILIEDGKLDHPVREITIASTLPDLLKNVVGICDDIRFISMGVNIGSPTIAIEGITVAGR